MQRYLSGLATFVTLLEVHKLMYFMQFTSGPLAIAEERLRLQGWLSSEVAAAH